MSKYTLQTALPFAKKFLKFVDKAVSPWHAVDTVKQTLLENGFEQLVEKNSWKLKKNGKYFLTRNESTIITFTIGGNYNSSNGFKIIGAHTDSPDLKIKPVSKRDNVGFSQMGVQTYGGGLWHTWFDRDLTVAGRVIVKNEKENDGFSHKLVKIDKPILRIPNLAIHLTNDREKFVFNKETELLPILSTTILNQLQSSNEDEKKEEKKEKKEEKEEKKEKKEEKHHSLLLELLSDKLKCKKDEIIDLELSVIDTQPSQIGGIKDEFIFSPRLDNLMSCFCSLEGFLASLDSVKDDSDIRLLCFFDHEEVGSASSHGAGSSVLKDTIKRISKLFKDEKTEKDYYNIAISKSFVISSDMAHGIHPNYSSKHESKNAPMIHKGPVVKTNANQRYATNSVTGFLIKEIARRNGIPVQEFVVRNDMGCGSTIGSILASGLGIRVVDIGNPQFSMHSIREMCGTLDVQYSIDLFKAFFRDFRKIDESLKIDDK